MTELYEARELIDARKKVKFYNYLVVGIVVLWLFVNAVIFVLRQNLPWGESDTLYRMLAIFTTAISACSVFFIISLPRRMAKGYVRVYSMILNGDPTPVEGVFLGQDEEVTQRYGVDFHELIFFDGVNEKGREMISRILVDAEKDISDMQIGDKIRYCTLGTVLSCFEVLEKESISQDDIDVLIKRMGEHIGMDNVIFGEEKKKKRRLF